MSVIGRLLVRLGLDNSQYKAGLTESDQKTSMFGKSVQKLGGIIAGAFAIGTITRFVREVTALAGKSEGIERAFNRIADTDFLANLRTATQGMVSDLELMKNTVKAQNFRIPLEQLATYFQFATVRASETGESVDYLVDSIITGLGRQSVMILDNLGLSAAEIREEMARGASMAEAVGTIIAKSMADGATEISKSTKAVTNLTVEWDNFKVSLGKTLNNFLTPILTKINEIIASAKQMEDASNVQSKSLGQRVAAFFNPFYSANRAFSNARIQAINDTTQEIISSITTTEKAYAVLAQIQAGFFSPRDINVVALSDAANAFLKTVNKETPPAVSSIAALKLEIDQLTIALENEGDAAKRLTLVEQIKQKQELIKQYLGEADVIKTGTIPLLEKEIALKKSLLDFEKDQSKILAINSEIAVMEKRLSVLRMTKEAYDQLYQYKTTPLPVMPGAPQQQVTTGVRDIRDDWNIKNRLEDNADAMKAFNAKMEAEANESERIADMFKNTFVNILGNSIEHLSDIIAGTSKLNTGQVVAALLMPLADMAITAGGIILSSGIAIDSLKAALTSFLGGSAVAAGAALIAVGTAAKVGLKALAKPSTPSQPMTSFSGGGGGMSVRPEKVELFAKVSGADILLSSQRAELNKRR